jgi:hypothetical protein
MSRSDVHSDKIKDIRMRITVSRHVTEALFEKIVLIQTLTEHLHNEHEERRSPEDLAHRKAILSAQWDAIQSLLSSWAGADTPVKKAISYFKNSKEGK